MTMKVFLLQSRFFTLATDWTSLPKWIAVPPFVYSAARLAPLSAFRLSKASRSGLAAWQEQSKLSVTKSLCKPARSPFKVSVYFAKYPGLERNLLGRSGWLRNLRLGLIDYDNLLYLSEYNS
ncbi:MAG: hypothetical protein ABI977_35915 [Acidobacteriota bacterium]